MSAAKKVNADYRIPIVVDDRVPPGMAAIGYDASGELVALVNLNAAVLPAPRSGATQSDPGDECSCGGC